MEKKQSNFSRSLANEAKMGAYLTDRRICEVISTYIDYGTKNVNVLEPTVGDASAVLTVTKGKENVSIFGVELSEDRYQKAKNYVDNGLYKVILSDFLKARITNKKMDMIFSNPPYLTVFEERFESVCLSRCTRYLSPKGFLVYIVGASMSQDEEFIKYLVANYEDISIFRFPTAEEYKDEYDVSYQFFNQICIFAYKREDRLFLNSEKFEDSLSNFKLVFGVDTEIVKLITQVRPLFKIKTSHRKEAIDEFKGDLVDVEGIMDSMGMWNIHQRFSKALELSDNEVNLFTPPIDPKKEHKYFIALSSTSAIIGEEGERHLLRTSVMPHNAATVDLSGDNGDKVRVKSVTNAKVVANVLNADGTTCSIM
jgi:hypothetical protein